MHPHFPRILKRANHLLARELAACAGDIGREFALREAYGKLNPGKALRRTERPLPPDPDGSETLTAARFIAHALGLKFIEHTGLDSLKRVSSRDVVVLRRVAGERDPSYKERKQQAQKAWWCIEVLTGKPEVKQAFGHLLESRRKTEKATAPPRQPSIF